MAALRNVAVIAIDGADRATLERHVEAGRLPNVARLIGGARSIDVSTLGELFLSSPWPCFASSVAVEHHGIHAFRPLRSGTLDIVEGHELVVPTPFWETAVRAGRRATVLDVPFCAPPQAGAELDGLRFVEWGAHPALRPLGAYPPELARDLYPHPCPEDDPSATTAREAAAVLARLCEGARRRAELLAELRRGHQADLVVTVFSEVHSAAHQFANLEVAEHPCRDPALVRALGPAPLDEVYAAVDRAIATMVDDDATVLLVGLGGVRVTYGGSQLLGDALVRLGLTVARAPLLERVRRGLPAWLRKQARRRLPMELRRRAVDHRFRASIDWRATRAVALPWAYDGYLRVNQRGREPYGIVAPGAERDALLAEVEDAVRALRVTGTGEPAVAKVVRAQEAFPGRASAELPDLLVLWNNARPLVAVESPALGRIDNRDQGGRPAHAGGGVVYARGPGIAAGPPLAARDLDLGPTILALLGVTAPAGLDGRVIGELLA